MVLLRSKSFLSYFIIRDQGEVLAEALKIMLCDDRQHDMQRAAAFIKCLASFSLCFGATESMAALVTLKQLLQKNVKCHDLLENDAGGGSLPGSILDTKPYIKLRSSRSVHWDQQVVLELVVKL
ncbi:nucleolar complex protein 3 [Tanacetum coccineum]